MRIIKLNAIDSTNSYLKQLSMEEFIADDTIVVANYQTQGRGQMGTSWVSTDSKNLMFSVFKEVSFLPAEQSFYISIATSLAIIKALEQFLIPKLRVKWPNDILSENKKICGVLIENVIKQSHLKATIIGIGLNVNQTDFNNLPKASSLHLLTGKVFDLDEVLRVILENLTFYFNLLKEEKYQELKDTYESLLFRKDKPSTFKNAEGSLFSGFIKSISNSGNLQVLLEDDVLKEFDLKEVSLLY
ncbi:biotin--[acetyl-CoA-carboxylase] ligase [Xanthomarina spongicola]|jgi:BirA family biotin operon repressor/biotin-[acetyl-CoA-carboxylase] ligase|uniref:BirA family biotin operon repressor/biotin-[acetyl-CoA-carboxylase] ligase n=1 Tax=Xanthomarina spongicola TaxID=570520 RepID=A0A316DH66_9FLAO|nr:biotin--[acetyl-CoA-carboxylase] ligase [Xanthomarina spongicola]PWK17521.1 BirA family biotin operon repressor/biotin-[acetyl-CoA-carboxylase] ligase [Xanthomarina spongicola]